MTVLNSYSSSPESQHIITTKSKLNILIDSGASSSVINPEIAHKLCPNYIFDHKFEIKSVHNRTKGSQALTYPILREFGETTPITFLIAPWYGTYDCLIGHKDLENLGASIDYKNQIFSTYNFKINYLNNIPDKCKIFSLNNHEKVTMLIRTEHMNEEEKYKDCFYNEQEKLSATNAVKHSIRTKGDHPI